MRDNDWNDDPPGDAQGDPAPLALVRPSEPLASPDPPTSDAQPPTTAPRAPLSLTWPILLVGGLTIGLICVMFSTIIFLIVSR